MFNSILKPRLWTDLFKVFTDPNSIDITVNSTHYNHELYADLPRIFEHVPFEYVPANILWLYNVLCIIMEKTEDHPKRITLQNLYFSYSLYDCVICEAFYDGNINIIRAYDSKKNCCNHIHEYYMHSCGTNYQDDEDTIYENGCQYCDQRKFDNRNGCVRCGILRKWMPYHNMVSNGNIHNKSISYNKILRQLTSGDSVYALHYMIKKYGYTRKNSSSGWWMSNADICKYYIHNELLDPQLFDQIMHDAIEYGRRKIVKLLVNYAMTNGTIIPDPDRRKKYANMAVEYGYPYIFEKTLLLYPTFNMSDFTGNCYMHYKPNLLEQKAYLAVIRRLIRNSTLEQVIAKITKISNPMSQRYICQNFIPRTRCVSFSSAPTIKESGIDKPYIENTTDIIRQLICKTTDIEFVKFLIQRYEYRIQIADINQVLQGKANFQLIMYFLREAHTQGLVTLSHSPIHMPLDSRVQDMIVWDRLHSSSKTEHIEECKFMFTHGIIPVPSAYTNNKYKSERLQKQIANILPDIIDDMPSDLPDIFILAIVRGINIPKYLDILPKLLTKRIASI